jgi:hypothetical protein
LIAALLLLAVGAFAGIATHAKHEREASEGREVVQERAQARARDARAPAKERRQNARALQKRHHREAAEHQQEDAAKREREALGSSSAPASISEESTCGEYLRAAKREREEVGQIATFSYNVSFETEGFCERHPSERVKFAICEVLEGFQGISRTANGSGLPAGQLDELRERYPWCF